MKKVLMMILVGVFLFVGFQQTGLCQPPRENLYNILSDAKQVNVYISEVKDSSGQAGDMVAGIRKNLENEFKTRMTINFVIVDKGNDADIIVSCDVVERVWYDHDPVDQIHGIGAIAADAAMDEDYGRIQADFVVRKGPRKMLFRRIGKRLRRMNTLYAKTVQADITQGNMPEEESKTILEAHLPEVFMRKCFSKNARSLVNKHRSVV